MGITVIPRLIEETEETVPLSTQPAKITIRDVLSKSKYYRHPDSARITYPLVVEKPLGTIPKREKKLEIAIIGGGVAGITSYYELSRIKDSKDLINVTLFESDLEHFAISKVEPFGIDTFGKKAGRIFAARSIGDKSESEKNRSVYEIGAMRFPEIAGLTWHYAKEVFNENAEITVFPNPGKVPTEFVCGNRVDRYYKSYWLDEKSPTKLITQIVTDGLLGNGPSKDNISYYRIGGKDPAKISEELKSEKTPPCRLEEIKTEWRVFAKEYDGLTLESAVRKIIRDKASSLPPVEGLNDCEDKINYYAEIFGCFGFGTGGFKPIFNTSLAEMMRLILWSYSNEYTLPVEENVDFMKKLYDAAAKGNPNITVKPARVCDVCHLIDENQEVKDGEIVDGKAAVFSYPIPELKTDLHPEKDIFDYVILAVTPKQMNSIISRAGFINLPRKVELGDHGRQSPKPLLVRPPLVLSDKAKVDAPNSKVFSAINQAHMISSSKIFATIPRKEVDGNTPILDPYGEIRAVISDCGLASSYIVPSPFSSQLQVAENTFKYYTLLLSYAWEEDTKRLLHHLYEYPINREPNSKNNNLMINAAINRTLRHVIEPLNGEYGSWWFGKLLSNPELTDTLSYDWTTEHSAGAFKLDTTGCYYNSSLLFRYHTHALKPALKNRFFIAGDSYSHLGGWIEGAFISAVNAVTGLIVAVNDGDVNKLASDEVRNVMLTLEPVA